MSHKLSMCQGLTFIYWNWYNDLTVSQALRKGLCSSFSCKYNWTQVSQRLKRILNCTWIPECVTRFCFHRMALEHSSLVHRRGNYLRDFMKLCDTRCTNVLLLGCWEKIMFVSEITLGFMVLCSTALAFLHSCVISIGYKEKVEWNCHFLFNWGI